MSVNVLMLAWEYPPHHVGGLGRHVYHLSRALSAQGVRVTVATRSGDGRPAVWDDEGVTVVATPPNGLHPPDFVTWAAQFNVGLLQSVMANLPDRGFDLIHAHDWIVAYAADALKHAWGVPLVATIHATEHGRQRGLHSPMQHHISETEWWLCYEACRVVTCSRHMRNEVSGVFGVPSDKIRVIPNGIDAAWFRVRRNPSSEPLVIYVGRLVPEKGPQTIVDAMSMVLESFPNARLVIAGDGPMEGELRRRIYQAGLGQAVQLVGRQDDEGLRELYSRAWIATFPSSYEPFGIVALEAMSTGSPCIVGDAGGLREIVDDGYTGLKVRPDDPSALAGAVKTLISDPGMRERLTSVARTVAMTEYSWDDVARKTRDVYNEALGASRYVGVPQVAGGEEGCD